MTGNASPLRLAEAHIARVVFGDRPHALSREFGNAAQADVCFGLRVKSYFKREVLASLFEELLAEFIQAELQRFNPQQTVFPISDRDDLEVDWEFLPNGVPRPSRYAYRGFQAGTA